MNTTDKQIDSESIDTESQSAQNEDSCKNGVCELNWQPKRPQAA